MDNINLNINQKYIQQAKAVTQNTASTPAAQTGAAAAQSSTPKVVQQTPKSIETAAMGSAENASYIKEMMKLPKNFNALIYIIQKNLTAAQLQAQLNKNLLAGKQISQTQAQILAQLQGLNSGELLKASQLNQTLLAQLEASIKKLPISASGMINIADLATLIKANGKDALTQIIISMANSAKNGINDVSQMKDAAKLINASIAAAGQKDNAQTLKVLMLLYLPWLPLQQGVDFDLEIQSQEEKNLENSILIIRIQTIHYGEIVVTLTLEDANAIDINIQCSDEFPKDELSLRLNAENSTYSAKTSLSYTSKTPANSTSDKTKATINMSNTNEINPYLLLTAHLIIRHVVEIDKE